MPNQDDSSAIDGLFDRIEDVSRNSAPRDADAEALIQQRLQQFPPAPYYMAQTILIQEEALRQAQAKIDQLEGQGQQRGGFLGGIFGSSEPERQPQRQSARSRGLWDQGDADQPRRGQGGGFLAGAAQTALGITGGVLLGSAIGGMMSGGANADEYVPEPEADQNVDETDTGGDDFGGDDDNFDMGGDF